MILIGKKIEFSNTSSFRDFEDIIKDVNVKGYDYLYVKGEAYSDADKENFFHNMIEIVSMCEKKVLVEFPLTHFEDMKKLYYANVCQIIASEGTTLEDSVIEDGKKRFGDKLVVYKKDFNEISSDFEIASSYPFILGVEPEDYNAKEAFYLTDTSKSTESAVEFKNMLESKGFDVFSLKCEIPWEKLKKNADGLIPAIVVDYKSDKILMLAYMNEDAYNNTFKTGLMNYYSRSRNSQWIKGETSGHFQFVKYIKADCDFDTLLCGVSQIGVPCHTGRDTCFFNDVLVNDSLEKNPSKILTDLYKVIEDRKVNPKEGSYTNYLFDKGLDKILKKVGEEACEIVIASKNEEPKEIKYEIADFLYHLSVLMVEKGVTWEEVADELAKR
jgi:phosphoribosyl-ATP pyrophosphohydrolase/phosphoribosyl-AMP cyclohydrolase